MAFGQNNAKPTTPAAAAMNTNDSGATCVIAEGTVIDGKFTCSENVRLDGKIIGEVKVQKKLVMGTSGIIEGTINATNTAVQGKIVGNLKVEESLQLLATANIQGDINANAMSVEEGAVYNGKINVVGRKK
jgi:cytoskeletal protein CcmA (bactofilin family)